MHQAQKHTRETAGRPASEDHQYVAGVRTRLSSPSRSPLLHLRIPAKDTDTGAHVQPGTLPAA